MMDERKLKVDVRTVDGFQGQEREIIVFSAVRANDDGHGWKQVGFLDDPHRMNVLLTRARRGLVVVGNSETLASNELWKSWIDYAEQHGLIVDHKGNSAQHTSPRTLHGDVSSWRISTAVARLFTMTDVNVFL